MKIPKSFAKMTPSQQETWLVNKLLQIEKDMDAIRRLLATIRGGGRIHVEVDDRPDLIALKAE